jgi:hypothetical protein
MDTTEQRTTTMTKTKTKTAIKNMSYEKVNCQYALRSKYFTSSSSNLFPARPP